MSFEGGVMSTEAMLNIALVRVTPKPGKGALGTRWFLERKSVAGLRTGVLRDTHGDETVGRTL